MSQTILLPRNPFSSSGYKRPGHDSFLHNILKLLKHLRTHKKDDKYLTPPSLRLHSNLAPAFGFWKSLDLGHPTKDDKILYELNLGNFAPVEIAISESPGTLLHIHDYTSRLYRTKQMHTTRLKVETGEQYKNKSKVRTLTRTVNHLILWWPH